MRLLLRIAYIAALGGSTYAVAFLSLHQYSGKYHGLVVVAAVMVASGVLIQAWAVISERFGSGNEFQTDPSIDRSLRGRLVDFYRTGIFGDQFPNVGLHVWIVPRLYRTVFPYKLRRALKRLSRRVRIPEPRRMRWSVRPALRRIGYEELARHSPSNVRFKKGYGLIGECLRQADDEGDDDSAYYADLRGGFVHALAQGEESWDGGHSFETWGLSFKDAQKLSGRYGQALAMVLRASSGEAIGCVTLSVPQASTISLQNDGDVRSELTRSRNLIQDLLSRHKFYMT